MRPPKFTRDALREDAERFGYEIGEYSYGAPAVWSLGHGDLKIGKFCSIAPGVEFLMMGIHHFPDAPTTYPLDTYLGVERPRAGAGKKTHITIGNDVWLSHGCTVLAGVTIGDGAIVAARAIVTRDVEPYAIVAGNPAREIRKRFTDAQIATLLKIRWWDWPIDQVREFGGLLLTPDIDAFIEAALAIA